MYGAACRGRNIIAGGFGSLPGREGNRDEFFFLLLRFFFFFFGCEGETGQNSWLFSLAGQVHHSDSKKSDVVNKLMLCGIREVGSPCAVMRIWLKKNTNKITHPDLVFRDPGWACHAPGESQAPTWPLWSLECSGHATWSARWFQKQSPEITSSKIFHDEKCSKAWKSEIRKSDRSLSRTLGSFLPDIEALSRFWLVGRCWRISSSSSSGNVSTCKLMCSHNKLA